MSGFAQNANRFQGRGVAATAPTNGQVYTWVAADSLWEPQAGGGGGGANPNDPFVVNGTAADLPNAQQLSSVQGAGVLASRPAASAANQFWYYFATDTSQWYQNLTGAAWTAFTPLGTDTTKLAIANNLSDVANALTSFNNISPLTTRGDLLTRDASNNVRLALGAAQTAPASNGTDLVYRPRTYNLFSGGGFSPAASITTTKSMTSGLGGNTQGALSIPAGSLAVGDILVFTLGAYIQNNSGGASTMYVDVTLGGTASGQHVATSFASGANNRGVTFQLYVSVNAIGAGTTTLNYAGGHYLTTGVALNAVILAQTFIGAANLVTGSVWSGLDSTSAIAIDVIVGSTVNNFQTDATLIGFSVERIGSA